jgi:hypothetical protein
MRKIEIEVKVEIEVEVEVKKKDPIFFTLTCLPCSFSVSEVNELHNIPFLLYNF